MVAGGQRPEQGAEMAVASIDSGGARKVLETLVSICA